MASKQVTVKANVVADTKGFATGLNKATKSLERFGSKATRIGRDISTFISLPIAAAATAAIKTATAFEFAQKKISALRGGRNIDNLTKSARELGASTIFTATEISELQLSLAKLGKSNQTIQRIQGTVLQFAQAMDMQLAPAGEFLVKTMNRFADSLARVGPEAEQAAYVGNLFAAVAANTAINAETLAASLNYVGSEAAAAGFDLADTTALLGLLADRGFDASRGGTALRRILAQLAKDGFTAEEALEELLNDSKGFSAELEQFGLRGAGPAAALGGLRDEFIKLRLEISNSEGFLQGFATTLDTSLQASFKRVQSASQELSISFVDSFGGELLTLTDNLARFIRGLADMSDEAKSAVANSGVLTVAFGAIVTVLGVVAGAVAFLVSAVGAIPTAIIALIGAIGAGLAQQLAFAQETDATVLSLEELRRALSSADKGFEDIAKTKFVSEDQLRKLAQFELTLNDLNNQLERNPGMNPAEASRRDALIKQIEELTAAQADYAKEVRLSIRRRQELDKFLGPDNLPPPGESLNEGDTLNKLLERRLKLLDDLDRARRSAKAGDILDPESVKKISAEIADLEKVLKLYGITFDDLNKKKDKDIPIFDRDIIDEFEKAQRLTDFSFGDGSGDIAKANIALQVLEGRQKSINLQKAEELARTGLITEETTKLGEEVEALIGYYKALGGESRNLAKEEKERADATKKALDDIRAKQQAREKELEALMEANAQQIRDTALAVGQFFGSTISRAFQDAINGSATFAESLRTNLLSALNRVLAKVIALIAAFAILSILSGGTSTVAFAAKNALGGQKMGQFIMSGMNMGSFNRSAGPNMRTEGYISGSDLVFGTRRGATALDRIYG